MRHHFERAVINAFKVLLHDVNFIKRELLFMTAQGDQLAAAVDGLVANVATLSDGVAAHDTAVQAELAALAAAIANSAAKDDPVVAAAISAVAASSANIGSPGMPYH